MGLKTWKTRVKWLDVEGNVGTVVLNLKIRKKSIGDLTYAVSQLTEIYNHEVNFVGVDPEKLDENAIQYRALGNAGVNYTMASDGFNMFGDPPDGYVVPQEIQDFFDKTDVNKTYEKDAFDNLLQKIERLFRKYVKLSFNDKLHSNPLLK